MLAPELETERLLLRGHAASDFDASCAIWGDPQVVQYIGGRPFSAQECWSRVLRYIGHWTLGYGYWAIVEKASGQMIGDIGFADFKREIDPPFGNRPEAGWVLAAAAHGKGYASEALAAVLLWSDESLDAESSVCLIDSVHQRSIKLAQKFGYQFLHQVEYGDASCDVYERFRGG